MLFSLGAHRYQDNRECQERFSHRAHEGWPVGTRHLNITHDQIQCVTKLFDPAQTLDAVLSFNSLELFPFQDGLHVSANGRFIINDQVNS